jgi:hypothetical protein
MNQCRCQYTFTDPGSVFKELKAEARSEYRKLQQDVTDDETGLYNEAQFKWLRLSQRERNYYEEKERELPMAMQRAAFFDKKSTFDPNPYESYVDLEQDTRFM